MPSKSKKQQDFMAAVANNPKFAKKTGVPQSVGKDYEKADKMKGMKKYQRGGAMPAVMANPRAGVTGVATPPTGPFPEPKMPQDAPNAGMPMTGSRPPRRINDPTPEQQRQAMRQARSAARRGGGGRKAGGSINKTMPGMKKGGSVRGAGCATKGTRAAKMVTMKGS